MDQSRVKRPRSPGDVEEQVKAAAASQALEQQSAEASQPESMLLRHEQPIKQQPGVHSGFISPRQLSSTVSRQQMPCKLESPEVDAVAVVRTTPSNSARRTDEQVQKPALGNASNTIVRTPPPACMQQAAAAALAAVQDSTTAEPPFKGPAQGLGSIGGSPHTTASAPHQPQQQHLAAPSAPAPNPAGATAPSAAAMAPADAAAPPVPPPPAAAAPVSAPAYAAAGRSAVSVGAVQSSSHAIAAGNEAWTASAAPTVTEPQQQRHPHQQQHPAVQPACAPCGEALQASATLARLPRPARHSHLRVQPKRDPPAAAAAAAAAPASGAAFTPLIGVDPSVCTIAQVSQWDSALYRALMRWAKACGGAGPARRSTRVADLLPHYNSLLDLYDIQYSSSKLAARTVADEAGVLHKFLTANRHAFECSGDYSVMLGRLQEAHIRYSQLYAIQHNTARAKKAAAAAPPPQQSHRSKAAAQVDSTGDEQQLAGATAAAAMTTANGAAAQAAPTAAPPLQVGQAHHTAGAAAAAVAATMAAATTAALPEQGLTFLQLFRQLTSSGCDLGLDVLWSLAQNLPLMDLTAGSKVGPVLQFCTHPQKLQQLWASAASSADREHLSNILNGLLQLLQRPEVKAVLGATWRERLCVVAELYWKVEASLAAHDRAQQQAGAAAAAAAMEGVRLEGGSNLGPLLGNTAQQPHGEQQQLLLAQGLLRGTGVGLAAAKVSAAVEGTTPTAPRPSKAAAAAGLRPMLQSPPESLPAGKAAQLAMQQQLAHSSLTSWCSAPGSQPQATAAGAAMQGQPPLPHDCTQRTAQGRPTVHAAAQGPAGNPPVADRCGCGSSRNEVICADPSSNPVLHNPRGTAQSVGLYDVATPGMQHAFKNANVEQQPGPVAVPGGSNSGPARTRASQLMSAGPDPAATNVAAALTAGCAGGAAAGRNMSMAGLLEEQASHRVSLQQCINRMKEGASCFAAAGVGLNDIPASLVVGNYVAEVGYRVQQGLNAAEAACAAVGQQDEGCTGAAECSAVMHEALREVEGLLRLAQQPVLLQLFDGQAVLELVEGLMSSKQRLRKACGTSIIPP